jgi:chromosome segregation ATPase
MQVGKLVRRASTKQLFDLAQVFALAEAQIASAQEAQRRAVNLVEEVRREQDTLKTSRDVLFAKTEELGREVSQRSAQIRELSADLEAARIRAMQDLSSIKARFRRQIGERLAGLLADAWNALDTKPAHPDVARERLDIAQEEIRRELEWLGKSSD